MSSIEQGVTRQMFAETITQTELPTLLVASDGFDMEQLIKESAKADLTVILGDLQGHDSCALKRISGDVVWVPGSAAHAKTGNDFMLFRRDRSVGCLSLAAAPFAIPQSKLTPTGDDAASSRNPARERLAALQRDAEFLQDVPSRRAVDGQLTVVLTVGQLPPLLTTDPDVRMVLREIGVRVKQQGRMSYELAALVRGTRRALTRYATLHVDSNGVYLPQMSLLPVEVGKQALRGARFDLVERPGEGVRSFSVADTLYRLSTSFATKSPETPIVLRDHAYAFGRAVSYVARYLSNEALTGVIEAMPLSALGSSDPIPIGVFVEGVNDDESRQMSESMNAALQRSMPGCPAFVCVGGVDSVRDVTSLVKVFDKSALTLIASVVLDQRRQIHMRNPMANSKIVKRPSETQTPEKARASGSARNRRSPTEVVESIEEALDVEVS